MSAFAAASGLEAAKELLRRYLTERSVEGTLELVTDDVVWFGTSAFERAFSREQLRRLITDEIAKDPTPMDAVYRDANFAAPASHAGVCTVALLLNAVKRDEGGSSLFIRVVFGCVETSGGWKIASANTTVPTELQQEGEYFPVSFAEGKQRQLRNEIIETTIAALESQDIFAWEYDIANGVCIYNERVSKKFGLACRDGASPARAVEQGVVLPESADEYLRVFREVSGGARETAAEIRCRDVMGAESLYRFKGIAIFDDAGKPLRAVFCVKDLTDMLARERERNEMLAAALRSAEAANRAKAEFLSRMSHEFRTPMNAIIGMTSIARNAAGDAAKIEDCLAKIELSSKFLLSLMNDIFDVARAAGGKNLLREEPSDLAELVDELNAFIYPLAEAKGVSYHSTAPRTLPRVLCDLLKLRQLLANLLSNAVKFTDRGGSVSFEITEKGARNGRLNFEFTIADNGRGISEEFLPRLWEPFAQETPGECEGTGLGLAIVKNLTNMMGGTISVSSIKGVGTKFTAEISFMSINSCEGGKLNGSRGLSVLVAEKDRGVKQCAASMLEALGMSPVCAGDMPQALAAARQGKTYDAVLAAAELFAPDPAAGIAALRKLLPQARIILTAEKPLSQEIAGAADAVLLIPIIKDLLAGEFSRLFSEESQTAAAADAYKAPVLQDLRILLAEDNSINTEVAAAVLAKAGCLVDTAANGLLALEKFARSPDGWYNAILMDLRMPVMDGLEATKNIRAMEKADAQTVPIIALTAQAFETDAEKCAAAGMNGHVAKPINEQELLALIEREFIKSAQAGQG